MSISSTTMHQNDDVPSKNCIGNVAVTQLLRNSDINRMTKQEIVENLKQLKLSLVGNKAALSKRLKTFYKRKRLMSSLPQPSSKLEFASRFYDYFCVVDFECTCVEGSRVFPHEIIEFPAFLVDVRTRKIVDTFHQFCRPKLNPVLSAFCTSLTGITQETVNNAAYFPLVFAQFQDWLSGHNLLGTQFRFAFVTDGPWDLGRFLQMQCMHSNLRIPHQFRYWVNIRRCYVAHYLRNKPRVPGLKLLDMLDTCGLAFEGRPHSGYDDTNNIARLLIAMLDDGVAVRVNERLASKRVLPVGSDESFNSQLQNLKLEESAEHQDQEEADSDSSSEAASGEQESGEVKGQWREVRRRQLPRPRKSACANLPCRYIPVSKPEFLANVYLDCDTCDSASDHSD